ncbi:MAG: PAS domain-containing protein [Candidatus Obscuribacter sp.]|nr:PAS domain-containing protein [Candidatus Obscuribacter sp.]
MKPTSQSGDKTDGQSVEELVTRLGIISVATSDDARELDQYGSEKDEQLLLLKRAVESARNGVCITNPRLPDNPIIYVNDAFLEMTGFSKHQILGRNCRFCKETTVIKSR